VAAHAIASAAYRAGIPMANPVRDAFKAGEDKSPKLKNGEN
jgi:multisubunit Na+/H+ antiporter MnhG subunit